MSGDAEAATEFVKMTNQELVELADVSETGFRGLKTLQQGGNLAGKTIQTNLKQARLGLGAFADLPETVRDEYVRMFEDLGTASKLSGNKLSSEMSIATSKARLAFVKFKQAAVSQLNKIAVAAQRTALKIATVFTRVISGIGIASLLGEGVMKILEKFGITFDTLSKDQQKYLNILENLNEENASFVELQIELNREFTRLDKLSKTVAINLGNFMKNIDFNEEARQIGKLIDSLQSAGTLSVAGASKSIGELGNLADEQLERLNMIRTALTSLIPKKNFQEGSKAINNFIHSLDEVIAAIEIARDGSATTRDGKTIFGTIVDLSQFARANSALVSLFTTVQELNKELPDVENKARDAFRELVPDNTYGPLIKDLESLEQKYDAIDKDVEASGLKIIAIDEIRKKRVMDLLKLFQTEQKRITEAKNTAIKRSIFEVKNSKLLTKFQKERLKSFKEEQSLLDNMTDIQGQINTIYQSAAILNKGVLEQEDQDAITNLILRKKLLSEQVDLLKESRKEMVRLNQAALDGAEQAIQKNIFDVLTGKENDLKAFLVKIAEGTYTTIASELSKILTENIFDIFSGKVNKLRGKVKNSV